ncbi:uncharacterized protein LOC128392212 isoform X2 [Panonychus citri]|uniref:uncharacterized protein LOC128392212 isoform X2 n=1 Tax=Panonychus citri TaxID=50023 RepID=UPI00230728CA|nr:uncharacterized protein LOC128392212 isoform X2 [Panonychus citri]
MKSFFFIACASLVIASAIGVTIKGDSCPTPTVPKGINYWSFSYFTKITGWYEIGRTDKTVPNTIRNTIEINHLYPGKVYILNKGTVKEPESVVLWDNQVDLTEGNFSGGSYYDIIEDEEPVSFNINQDGKQATFWMPYYSRTGPLSWLLAHQMVMSKLGMCLEHNRRRSQVKSKKSPNH